MKPVFLFVVLLQISACSLTDAAAAITYWSYPSSVTGIQGQNITITFVANLSDHSNDTTWKFVTINKESKSVISIEPGQPKIVDAAYSSRSSDLDLNVTQNGVIVTIKFTLLNLVKATDEGAYAINPFGTSDFKGRVPASAILLIINVRTKITSPNTSVLTVNELKTARLVCNTTGHPTPSINWTRDGVIVGTGSPFTTPTLEFSDDKACYTCIAYNGVLDAKTANVCLNVQYKPRNATVLSDRLTVCQNDTVNLTCTSGLANPAPSSYEFYNNGVLFRSSVSNVYEATATVGLPAVNKLVCVPRNLVGPVLESGNVEVTAKVTPAIARFPQATSVIEGRALTLFCNASGVPAPNITWSKVGGSIVGNRETYTISSVTRGDEGTYRCTASNGDECSNVTAEAAVVVNYPPENTNMTLNKSSNVFSLGERVMLTCQSRAKPSACRVLFYQGSQLLANKSSSTCTASHVISSIEGCNDEKFSCFAMNEAGTGERIYRNVTVVVPPGASVVPSSGAIVAEEGEALTLTCTPSGCPTPTVTWTKTGISSPLEQGSGVVVLNKTFSSLSKQDTGTYQCTVNNGVVGSPVVKMIYLNVTYKPENTVMTLNKRNNVFLFGEQVTLTCQSQAKPSDCRVLFYRGSTILANKSSSTCTASHVISSIQGFNEESFSCFAMNAVGVGERAYQNVTVKSQVVVNQQTQTNVTVKEGEDIMINCSNSAQGNGQWKNEDGSDIKLSNRIKIQGNNILAITNASTIDAGVYKCLRGNSIHIVNLRVTVTVKVEISLRILNWDFKNEIQNKNSLYYKSFETNFTKQMDKVYQNVSGYIGVEILEIRNGSVRVIFVVRVEQVINDKGEKTTIRKVEVAQKIVDQTKSGWIGTLRVDPSPEAFETDAPPPQPENVTIIEITDDGAELSWQKPKNHLFFGIKGYFIEYWVFASSKNIDNTGLIKGQRTKITGLKDETAYVLRVVAQNLQRGQESENVEFKTQKAVLADWIIALIVIFCILFLVLIIALIVFLCRRRKRMQREREQQDMFAMNKMKQEKIDEPEEGQPYLKSYINKTYVMSDGSWADISRENLVLQNEIGSGEFGVVYKGELTRDDTIIECAVKTLKESAGPEEYRAIYEELEIMANVGSHPNLVNLIGATAEEDKLYLIVEFARNGSLINYLRNQRLKPEEEYQFQLNYANRLRVALDVAKGMAHLQKKRCVHRDLAARNVLLADGFVAKVADFGMSRDIYETGEYEKTTTGKMPTRWMAIESLEMRRFTLKSDVWSFGVLLWEIETKGLMPHGAVSYIELLDKTKKGHRLEQPTETPDELYEFMQKCWAANPIHRPDFSDVCDTLETMLSGAHDHLEEAPDKV